MMFSWSSHQYALPCLRILDVHSGSKISIHFFNLLLILPKEVGPFSPPSSFLFLFTFLLPASILFAPTPHCFLPFSLSVSLELMVIIQAAGRQESQWDHSLTPRISDTETHIEKGWWYWPQSLARDVSNRLDSLSTHYIDGLLIHLRNFKYTTRTVSVLALLELTVWYGLNVCAPQYSYVKHCDGIWK